MECVKRVHGYLCRFKYGVIRIRTTEPDYNNMPSIKFDWTYTQYPDAQDYGPRGRLWRLLKRFLNYISQLGCCVKIMRIICDGVLCCFRGVFVTISAFQGPCRSRALLGSCH